MIQKRKNTRKRREKEGKNGGNSTRRKEGKEDGKVREEGKTE